VTNLDSNSGYCVSVELDPGYSAAQHGLLLKLVAVLTAAMVVEVRAYRGRIFEQAVEVPSTYDEQIE
jgi:hypothetical protein